MDTRLPVYRLAEAVARGLRRVQSRAYWIRAAADFLEAWVMRRPTDPRYCASCGTEILGTPTRAASGAMLCDDPACHAAELEGRW